jgi:hypothetical protein
MGSPRRGLGGADERPESDGRQAGARVARVGAPARKRPRASIPLTPHADHPRSRRTRIISATAGWSAAVVGRVTDMSASSL